MTPPKPTPAKQGKVKVYFQFISHCLWCEAEIPPKPTMEGKMICSKKCLEEMNKEHSESAYDLDDVWKITPIVKRRKR